MNGDEVIPDSESFIPIIHLMIINACTQTIAISSFSVFSVLGKVLPCSVSPMLRMP